MKFLLAVLVLIGFIGIGVLGFVAINHNGNGLYEHAGCFASATQGAPCPEKNPLAFASFHLSAFKFFSTATFDTLSVGTLSFLLLLFFSFSFLVFTRALPKKMVFPGASIKRFSESFFSRHVENFLSWLAIHENSPALFHG